MSFTELETSRLRGALAVRPWDAVLDRPTELPCRVTALRAADRVAIGPAVRHTGGLFGFLKLKTPKTYLVLVEPLGGTLLPSLRQVNVPVGGLPVALSARLLPAPTYAAPRHSVILRGTVYFKLPSPRPARWVAVFGRLAKKTAPATTIASAWTRTDGRGEFALPLRTTPPDADGKLPVFQASLEFFAPAPDPKAPLLDAADLSDLPVDADTDAGNRAPAPARRAIGPITVAPGDDLSINAKLVPLETFTGSSGAPNTVIFLSPT